jgi:hypothetical protein
MACMRAQLDLQRFVGEMLITVRCLSAVMTEQDRCALAGKFKDCKLRRASLNRTMAALPSSVDYWWRLVI